MINTSAFRYDALVLAERKFENAPLRKRILEQIIAELNQYAGHSIMLAGERVLISNAEEAEISAKVKTAVQNFFFEICEPRGIEVRILE